MCRKTDFEGLLFLLNWEKYSKERLVEQQKENEVKIPRERKDKLTVVLKRSVEERKSDERRFSRWKEDEV